MAGTTSNGIPYPEGSDNNDTAQAVEDLAEFIDSRIWGPGDVKATLSSSTPTGWLAFNQTVVGGQSTYPDLWAVLPASYKSGSNIVLPDPSDAQIAAVLTSPGTVGGSNSLTLVEGNLPAHTHTMSAHQHDLAHSHTTGSDSHNHTATQGSHTHGSSATLVGQSAGDVVLGSGFQVGSATISSASAGTITIGSDNHSHSVTDGSGNTGSGGPTVTSSVGSGSSIDVSGKTVELRLLVRT